MNWLAKKGFLGQKAQLDALGEQLTRDRADALSVAKREIRNRQKSGMADAVERLESIGLINDNPEIIKDTIRKLCFNLTDGKRHPQITDRYEQLLGEFAEVCIESKGYRNRALSPELEKIAENILNTADLLKTMGE